MRITVLAMGSIAALGLAGTATAQDSSLNIGYQNIEAEGVDLGSIVGRWQLGLNEYLAVEGEISYGVTEEEVFGVDVKAGFGFGGFVVGRLPVSETGSHLFVRAGYANQELEADGGNVTISDSVDGFAYGAGGTFMFDGINGVRLDYTKFEGDDDAEADIIGLSYVRKLR